MRLHENGLLRPKIEFLRDDHCDDHCEDHFVRHRWRNLRVGFRWVGRVLIFIFEAMFDGGRIVRQVGPGMRPLERHEFERHYEINGRNH